MGRSQGFGTRKTIIRIHCMIKSIFSKIKVEEKNRVHFKDFAVKRLGRRGWVAFNDNYGHGK